MGASGKSFVLAERAGTQAAVAGPQVRLFVPSLVLTGGTFAAGAFSAEVLGLTWLQVLPRFVIIGTCITVLAASAGILLQVFNLARSQHPSPIAAIRSSWFDRDFLYRLTLPAIVGPVFITGFVTLKAAATIAVPYQWDWLLADVDLAIFTTDPWLPLHLLFNHWIIPEFIEFTYVGWQLLLPTSLAVAAIWMPRRDAAVFFCAMFLTWVVAGVVVAALMHSVGPIFAYIIDDQLGARFDPLAGSLSHALGPESRVLHVQQALALGVLNPEVSPGGGISAMPSVHVAVTAIYVLAAWKHRYWRAAALIFAAMIWTGSVYTGYHYVTDGPVGFAIAITCWYASRNFIGLLDDNGAPSEVIVEGEAAVRRPSGFPE